MNLDGSLIQSAIRYGRPEIKDKDPAMDDRYSQELKTGRF
jgi:hypothetical protein